MPFGKQELLARIRAVMRRRGNEAEPHGVGELTWGSIVLDRGRHIASVSGERIVLTRTEYSLLASLVAAAATSSPTPPFWPPAGPVSRTRIRSGSNRTWPVCAQSWRRPGSRARIRPRRRLSPGGRRVAPGGGSEQVGLRTARSGIRNALDIDCCHGPRYLSGCARPDAREEKTATVGSSIAVLISS